jgi:DNA-binding NarL/FixJ family response regulator
MTRFIEQLDAQIEQRERELRDEFDRLAEARKCLAAKGQEKAKVKAEVKTRRKRTKDNKRDKIVKLSAEGKAVKDIAKALKVSRNYVYVVRRESLKAA